METISVHPAGDDAFLSEFTEESAGLMRGLSARLSEEEDIRACIAGHASLFVLVIPGGWTAERFDRIVASPLNDQDWNICNSMRQDFCQVGDILR